jgi:hypothetical protein
MYNDIKKVFFDVIGLSTLLKTVAELRLYLSSLFIVLATPQGDPERYST